MARRDLGKTPISEGSPAGQDVRNDPDFEALSKEIEKMSSPTLSGTMDWNRVLQLSEDILTNKSKDLLVLSYFSVALLKTAGLRGFALSVKILKESMEAFWEDMFPVKKRMRGRKNAIEWWQEKISTDLRDLTTQKWPKQERDGFLEDINAIDAFFAENMEEAPLLLPMINAIAGLVETIEETPAPEAALPQQTSGIPKESNAPAQSARPVAFDPTETDTDKLLNQGLEILGRAATLLTQQDPLNILSFRLNRIAAWTAVTALPPATAGKTLIPAPDGQIISALENLYQSHSWRDLLDAAESRVRQFLFWLDLSRYVTEALEQLGHQDGSAAVSAETCQYVKRLTGIERLAFDNGTPFANEETRIWINTINRQIPSGGGTAGSDETDIRQVVEKQVQEAEKASRDNKLPAALGAFTDKLNHAHSARERFIWQFGLCRLLLQVKQPRLAAPHLKELLQTMEMYRLEQWEPDMAVEVLSTVLTGLRLQAGQSDESLQETVLNRITTIDPVRAMEFV
ncbi:MAG: type VI secretion system protein TssA [Syntrophus sp. (in: bacteria)]